MSKSKPDTERDWSKFDAYVLTAADYDEIPEITDGDWERAVLSDGGAASDRAVAPRWRICASMPTWRRACGRAAKAGRRARTRPCANG